MLQKLQKFFLLRIPMCTFVFKSNCFMCKCVCVYVLNLTNTHKYKHIHILHYTFTYMQMYTSVCVDVCTHHLLIPLVYSYLIIIHNSGNSDFVSFLCVCVCVCCNSFIICYMYVLICVCSNTCNYESLLVYVQSPLHVTFFYGLKTFIQKKKEKRLAYKMIVDKYDSYNYACTFFIEL